MSHEYQTRPIVYIETDYDYDSDFDITYEYDAVNGFFYIEPIPDLARKVRNNRENCFVEQCALVGCEDERRHPCMPQRQGW